MSEGIIAREGRALIRGMAMALAETQNILPQPSIAGEVLASWGITSARQLRRAGVEAFDVRLLRDALKEAKRRARPSSGDAGTKGDDRG